MFTDDAKAIHLFAYLFFPCLPNRSPLGAQTSCVPDTLKGIFAKSAKVMLYHTCLTVLSLLFRCFHHQVPAACRCCHRRLHLSLFALASVLFSLRLANLSSPSLPLPDIWKLDLELPPGAVAVDMVAVALGGIWRYSKR